MIYILNRYREDGPENIRVCGSLERVRGIFEEILAAEWAGYLEGNWMPINLELARVRQERERSELAAILAENKIGSYNLGTGWGGYQLHIIELEK